MSEFNFKSQVCTSCLQSERLLALDLKKETADCYWFYCNIAKEWKCTILSSTQVFEDYPTTVIPAWSLHRLVSLTNTDDIKIACNEKSCWCGNVLKIAQRKAFIKDNLYDNIIDCIEWLIKEGYFNKEYLV